MRDDDGLNLPRYPAVRFLIRWGQWIIIALAAVPLLAAFLAAAMGMTWWWVLAAGLATPVLYLFLCSYLELIRIIGDTLLPR